MVLRPLSRDRIQIKRKEFGFVRLFGVMNILINTFVLDLKLVVFVSSRFIYLCGFFFKNERNIFHEFVFERNSRNII